MISKNRSMRNDDTSDVSEKKSDESSKTTAESVEVKVLNSECSLDFSSSNSVQKIFSMCGDDITCMRKVLKELPASDVVHLAVCQVSEKEKEIYMSEAIQLISNPSSDHNVS